MREYFDQQEFDVRCEWGERGARSIAPESDAVVVIDVLSFCTAVDIAASRGAAVYPYRSRDESARAYAQSIGAVLANSTRGAEGEYSLSPTSLLTVPRGLRLVLPSPNGSAISLTLGNVPIVAGCLRNAEAVASALSRMGKRISVIPAGEKWEDGSLRPAIEEPVRPGVNGGSLCRPLGLTGP
jgi:2-phosphosulfolactate phosphatase